MFKMYRLIISLISCFLIFSVCPISANANSPRTAVMVVVDRLTFEDLNEMNALKSVAARGGIGLLNTKTAGARSSENTYATIGSSVPMLATGTVRLAFNGSEKVYGRTAAEEYAGRTGLSVSERAVVQLGIARIWQQNSTLNQAITPGALGKTLNENGFKVGVLGNGDFNDEIFRPVVNIAMNSKGFVDAGNVGISLTLHDPSFPGGQRTDYKLLTSELMDLLDKVDFVVVDVGDLARLENQGNYVLESNLDKHRVLSIKRIDEFLSRLIRFMDFNNDLLVVVCPTPSDSVIRDGELITPVVVSGKGIEGGGLLTSGTTKRPGIITNTDLAPTILSFFDIEVPYYMSGRGVYLAPGDSSVSALVSYKNRLALIYSTRSALVKSYIFTLLILLLVSLYFIFFRKDGLFYLKPFLVFVMSVPLSLLILPLLPLNSSLAIISGMVLLSLALTFLCLFVGRKWFLGPFILISLATVVAIVVDLYFGAVLQKQSILGYDAIAGARFYGLGNEYMGVLLGATIISSVLLITWLPRLKGALIVFSGILYLMILYAIAAPNVGTNVGGTIAAAVGFTTSMLLLLDVRFNKKTVLFIPGIAFLIVTSFVLFDLQRDVAQQSHIGRNASLILSGGVGEILNIIVRKLEVNIKLIKYTIWSRFFLASLASLALLFYRPVGIMKTIRLNYPELFKGFIATMIAAVTALIFNDSGIVAAATAMIFAVPPFIFLVLYEQPVKV